VVGDTSAQRLATATAGLSVVLGLHRRGRREPLPLFLDTSCALYEGTSATGSWKRFVGGGEGDDPYTVLAFGTRTLSELRALRARPDDPPGGAPGRAQRYADHLWGTLAATVVDHGALDHDDDGGDPEPGGAP
jgi:hypothetical protein